MFVTSTNECATAGLTAEVGSSVPMNVRIVEGWIHRMNSPIFRSFAVRKIRRGAPGGLRAPAPEVGGHGSHSVAGAWRAPAGRSILR